MKGNNTLINEIKFVFSHRNNPPENIAYKCTEGRDIENSFKGLTWQECNFKIINHHYSAFSFFEDDAFVYFLPAYLILCIKNKTIRERFIDSIILSLTDEDSKNKIKLLTKDEKKVIGKFFLYFIDDEYNLNEDFLRINDYILKNKLLSI